MTTSIEIAKYSLLGKGKGFNLYEFHYRLVHCVSTENFNRNGKIFSFNKGCKVKSCVQNFS